jgi:hypothetical protein
MSGARAARVTGRPGLRAAQEAAIRDNQRMRPAHTEMSAHEGDARACGPVG